jgi:hypothetical protein
VQLQHEARDDAQVGSGAAHRPEEVVVLVAAGPAHLAVGRDDLDLDQVVDRPAEAPCEVAEAAPERQAGHAHLRYEAQRRGQTVELRLAVYVPQ